MIWPQRLGLSFKFFPIFVSFSFNLDNIHWPAFKFTNLFFCCIQSSVEHIQWTLQFWYDTFSVLEFPFGFLFIDSISLLKLSVCSHMLLICFTRPFPILITIILKILSVNSNIWVICGLLLLNFFSVESHFHASFWCLIIFHCVSDFVCKWTLEIEVHNIYLQKMTCSFLCQVLLWGVETSNH